MVGVHFVELPNARRIGIVANGAEWTIRHALLLCFGGLLRIDGFRLLGVVARKKYRLAAERIGIEVEVGVDLLLDVVVLRVELVVLRALRLGQLSVFTHNDLPSATPRLRCRRAGCSARRSSRSSSG